MRRFTYMLAAFGIGTFLPVGVAMANNDHAPTPEEKTKIEEVLRQKGFTSWKEIERDGRVWDVDNAVGADGKTYHLEMAADTLRITRQHID